MAQVYSPLAGIKVLDLTDLMGAYCGKLLSDMGAEVIKIEPPKGDASRRIAPFAHQEPNPEKSLVFAFYNSGKKGVTLDITSLDGKRIFLELLRNRDIILESFPPGYMDSLGLGYQRIRGKSPRLIMASITPFGQQGPRRDYQGTELTLLAAGGFTYECGESARVPCTAPGFFAYDLAGTDAATGTAMALVHRDFTGRGQHLDISVQESTAFHTYFSVPQWMNDGVYRRRYGAVAINYWPGDIFKTKDGKYILLMCFVPAQFKAVADWIGNDALKDPIWSDPKQRQDGVDFLRSEIQSLVSRYNQAEFVEESQRKHLPATPVNTVADYINDPQIQYRKSFQKVRHPAIGEYILPNLPATLGWGKKPKLRPAPLLGQHNIQIYSRLGISGGELATLKGSGVI